MEMLEVAPDSRTPDAGKFCRFRHVNSRRQLQVQGRPQQHVLKDLSLEQAGVSIALVGSSGVGKTTLCSLIPRFYDVTAAKSCGWVCGCHYFPPAPEHRVVQQDIYPFAGPSRRTSATEPNAT
jgi:ATP-binding cassette subfamily B protein